jgi:hypothetical protein
MSGLYPGSEIDPDARYAWDHDDPLEEDEDTPVVECAGEVVSMTNLPPYVDDCPF